MLPTNNDKKNLIESMKKLTNHISNNPNRQKQIFNSLSIHDLNKIIQNLSDENEYLRRISALLICELFYNHNELKLAFTKKFNIQPADGRICINGLSQSVQKYPSTLKKCLQLMKSQVRKGEENTLCWAINLDKKNLNIQHYQFKKYSSFTFLDPMRNIFGVCVANPNKKVPVDESEITEIESSSNQKIPSNNYMEGDNLSREKLLNSSGIYSRKYNLPAKQQEQKRASTSRQRESSVKSSKQKNFTFIKIKDFNFSKQQQKPKYSKNVDKKQKLGASIQSVSQYARTSYGRNFGQREKQSISFSQTIDEINEANKIKADRRLRERNVEAGGETKRSSIDYRYPQSTKHQHENFYKRVQEILRK